jgi:hypothetical protein
MNTTNKTDSMKDFVQTVFRSTEDGVLPGEVRSPTTTVLSYSLEGPTEFKLARNVERAPSLDIKKLPVVLEFAEGYRPDVVVFATSIRPGVMVTNLPVEAISERHAALCCNVAQKALLALSVSEGFTLEYLGDGYSLTRLADVGQEFADRFLRPMAEDEKTVIHEIADVRQWLAHQVWWKRSTESAPGTEFA